MDPTQLSPPDSDPDLDPATDRPLTIKQRRLVREYVRSGNLAQAARTAYPGIRDPEVARVHGDRTMRKPYVQRALRRALQNELTVGDTVAELAATAKLKPSPEAGTWDHKLKALDMAFRLWGAYPTERTEVRRTSKTLVAHVSLPNVTDDLREQLRERLKARGR